MRQYQQEVIMAENEMLEDLEFENEMTEMGDDQLKLVKFSLRQQNKSNKLVASHGRRIRSLEKKNFRLFGFVGLAGAFLGSAFVTIIDYLFGRG